MLKPCQDFILQNLRCFRKYFVSLYVWLYDNMHLITKYSNEKNAFSKNCSSFVILRKSCIDYVTYRTKLLQFKWN